MVIEIYNPNHVNTWVFPGGEAHCKLSESKVKELKGDNLINFKFRFNSNDDLFKLALVVDACDRIKKVPKGLHMHYTPYQQADRVFSEGEPLGISVLGRFINSLGFEAVFCNDIHSSVAVDHIDNIHVSEPNDFIGYVINSLGDVDILLPDQGAKDRFTYLHDGAILNAFKTRPNDGGNPIASVDIDNFNGRDIVIVDDICVGGRTFLNLYNMIKDRNIGKCYLAVTHGVFSNGLEELTNTFDGVFTTDSYRDFTDPNGLFVVKNDKYLIYLNVFQNKL